MKKYYELDQIQTGENETEAIKLQKIFETKVETLINLMKNMQHLITAEPKIIIKSRDKRTFRNFEEAIESAARIGESRKEHKRWEEEKEKLEAEIKREKEGIIGMLPFKNTWIKVNILDKSYGVGFYHDSYGGLHSKLEIMAWSSEMPELNDQLDYS